MNKSELIDAIADQVGGRAAATHAVDAVLDTIIRAVATGDRVGIVGFGTFEKRARGARTARNIRTGATIKVKATSVPAFRAGKEFKEIVSGAKKVAKAAKPAAKKAATKAAAKPAAKKTAAKKVAKPAAKKTTRPAAKPAAKKAAAKKTTARGRR